MKRSALLALITSFSPLEIREIRKFLHSPLYNQREDLQRLFELLLDRGAEQEKQRIWQHLMGNKPYDDQQLRLLMSYLHRLLEQYLVWKERHADELENHLVLAIAYRRRGMPEAFERTRRILNKMLTEQPLRDAGFYQKKYRLDWEAFQLAFLSDPTDVDLLKQLSITVELSFLSQQLRIVCLLTSHSQVYRAPLSEDWAAQVLAMATLREPEAHPSIEVYLQCYRMLRYPEEEENFYAFKRSLFQFADFFGAEELHSLYIWAINYCVRRINSAEEPYFREALDLYKAGLEKGYIFENGELSRFTYHNIVAAGLYMEDLDWVRFFINEYKNRLAKQYRESSFSFNLARLEFANRNYHYVMELLQKANYRDPLLNLAAKMLLVKTFYESGDTETIPYHLDAMRNYIHRKRVIGYHRSNYLRIIRYIERILTVNPMERRAVQELKLTIDAEQALTEKAFLQKMLLVFQ